MFSYIWPLALIVCSNIAYNICAKSVPAEMNPFASLIVTYMVGALVALVFYFAAGRTGSFSAELGKMNWAPVLLGISIVGLEAGYLFAYKAGWPVSAAALTQGAILAVALLAVGYFAYKEQITPGKLAGVALCLAGIYLINR